jgi:hypothetical protein
VCEWGWSIQGMHAGSGGYWRLGFELWIRDPAQIKALRLRKQKMDAWWTLSRLYFEGASGMIDLKMHRQEANRNARKDCTRRTLFYARHCVLR